MVRERADRNGGSASIPASTSLNVAELRQLITLMDHSDIEEITIEHEGDGLHLTLRKPAPVALEAAMAISAEDLMELPADGAEPVAEADADSNALDVRSTLVGYYRAVGKPGAKPPEVGDKVKAGQIIGAVEALRVLNEVESPSAGRIRAILVGDGQPIEYGQVLMKVEPLEV